MNPHPAPDTRLRTLIRWDVAMTLPVGLAMALLAAPLAAVTGLPEMLLRSVGRDDFATDALTGEDYGEVPSRGASKIKVNNQLRSTIRAAIGTMTLKDPDPARRLSAAQAAFAAPDARVPHARPPSASRSATVLATLSRT